MAESINPTATSIIEEAKDAAKKELTDAAKRQLEAKYRELHAAQLIVANIEREIDDIELEITQKFHTVGK